MNSHTKTLGVGHKDNSNLHPLTDAIREVVNMMKTTDDTIMERKLNVDKIESLDDVRRVLKFLNITAKTSKNIKPEGYEDVRDLFEDELSEKPTPPPFRHGK